MKTLTLAAIAVITAVLAVPAYSQGRGMDRKEEPKVNPEKKKADDKAYSDALSRIPAKEYDPWQGVREKTPAPPKKTGR